MLNINSKNISHSLSSIKSLIKEIINNSENDFISIGSCLRTFHNESKEITYASITSVKILSEELFSKGITELEELLHQLNSYLNRFNNEINTDKEDLNVILENCALIYDEVSQFRNIVKQLKILGVSTKIESERLGSHDLGFMALANGVETLSEVIDSKSSEIKKQSASLIKEINSIILNLTKVEHVQHEQSELILNTTSSALEIFRSKNSKCCHILNGISESSEDVSINISEIVTSIQMHDITRQKFEHVNSAIDIIAENCNENLDKDENDVIDNLYQIKDSCYLQAAQIQDANSEFCKSVLSIVESLKTVEASVTKMFEFS
jgi:methyl-accepting chemotaxis protein